MADIKTRARNILHHTGYKLVCAFEEIGFGAKLMGEAVYWLVMGKAKKQPVRLRSAFSEMMETGVRALPIITVMNAMIGIMLAIQGIYSLKPFGAEQQVVLGLGMSVVREFGPLITAILVAGRSGSALAARLGTMTINQEIDALNVMGINPVRFLVSPSLVAMLVMLPCLTFWADIVGLFAAGLYVTTDLGMDFYAYFDRIVDIVRLDDLAHGLTKSVIFALLIVMIGVVNGASVTGGAEGVGRMTTRSVVHGISAIVLTDMVFVFVLTR